MIPLTVTGSINITVQSSCVLTQNTKLFSTELPCTRHAPENKIKTSCDLPAEVSFLSNDQAGFVMEGLSIEPANESPGSLKAFGGVSPYSSLPSACQSTVASQPTADWGRSSLHGTDICTLFGMPFCCVNSILHLGDVVQKTIVIFTCFYKGDLSAKF